MWRLDFVPGYGLQGSALLRLLPHGFSHADQSAIWMRDGADEEVETECESTTLRHVPMHAQLSVGEHIFAGVEATLTLCPFLRTWMEEIEFPEMPEEEIAEVREATVRQPWDFGPPIAVEAIEMGTEDFVVWVNGLPDTQTVFEQLQAEAFEQWERSEEEKRKVEAERKLPEAPF